MVTGALDRSGVNVAMINGFPPERFTWRHGSINDRRRRLARSVGVPVNRLPAKRGARRAKLTILLTLGAGVAIAAVEAMRSGAPGA